MYDGVLVGETAPKKRKKARAKHQHDDTHVLCYKLERKHAGKSGANTGMLSFTVLLVCELLKGEQYLVYFCLLYNSCLISMC